MLSCVDICFSAIGSLSWAPRLFVHPPVLCLRLFGSDHSLGPITRVVFLSALDHHGWVADWPFTFAHGVGSSAGIYTRFTPRIRCYLKNSNGPSEQRAVAMYKQKLSYSPSEIRPLGGPRTHRDLWPLPTTVAVPCSFTIMSLFLVLDRYRKSKLTRDISCPV